MSNSRDKFRAQAATELFHEIRQNYAATKNLSLISSFVRFLDDRDGQSLLRFLFWDALHSNDWTLAEQLLGVDDFKSHAMGNSGPLHHVINEGVDRVDLISWLLRHGADIEQRSVNNMTPLIAASFHGLPLVVAELLNNGANVGARTEIDNDVTAIMAAASMGHTSTVECLLDRVPTTIIKTGWAAEGAACARDARHERIAAVIEARLKS